MWAPTDITVNIGRYTATDAIVESQESSSQLTAVARATDVVRAVEQSIGAPMRVLVLGGDGFCGWPTSLYLSDQGHDITIVDNLSRRNIDIELEVDSLTPIRPIGERLRAWKEVSGREIRFVNLNLATDYDRLVAAALEIQRAPDVRILLRPAGPVP